MRRFWGKGRRTEAVEVCNTSPLLPGQKMYIVVFGRFSFLCVTKCIFKPHHICFVVLQAVTKISVTSAPNQRSFKLPFLKDTLHYFFFL